jgi:broad specificity phosphatase PhoE
MNIYLLRHAETKENINGMLSSTSGDTLSGRGIEQSMTIVDKLQPLNIDRILCSPYPRAVKTIEPYSNKVNKTIEVHPCLAEGQLILEASTQQEHPTYELVASDYRYPIKSETAGQFLSRAKEATNLILAQNKSNILVVSHGHMIREILNNMLVSNFKLRFPHDNCGLSCISTDTNIMVKYINRNIDCIW